MTVWTCVQSSWRSLVEWLLALARANLCVRLVWALSSVNMNVSCCGIWYPLLVQKWTLPAVHMRTIVNFQFPKTSGEDIVCLFYSFSSLTVIHMVCLSPLSFRIVASLLPDLSVAWLLSRFATETFARWRLRSRLHRLISSSPLPLAQCGVR